MEIVLRCGRRRDCVVGGRVEAPFLVGWLEAEGGEAHLGGDFGVNIHDGNCDTKEKSRKMMGIGNGDCEIGLEQFSGGDYMRRNRMNSGAFLIQDISFILSGSSQSVLRTTTGKFTLIIVIRQGCTNGTRTNCVPINARCRIKHLRSLNPFK